MADTYSVSFMLSTMRGAPVIDGNTPGCLIAALDAVLVTGWGAAAPTSVVVASGLATATFASATDWQPHAVIEVSGGTPSAINGKARVATSVGNTLTWATSAADGTYTGAISIKYASAGWEKVFSEGTTKAVYRSTDVTSSRRYYRVDDSNNQKARVRGFGAMTDVNTGTEPFPTDAMISGGGYFIKSYYAADSTAIPYLIAANSKTMLNAICLGVAYGLGTMQAGVRGWGDPISLNPAGDIYSAFLSAKSSNEGYYLDIGALDGSTGDSSSYGFTVAMRSNGGPVGAAWLRPFPESGLLNSVSGGCDYFGAAPSTVDGQVKHCRMLLKDQVAGSPARAVVPGVRYIPQTGARTALDAPLALVDGAGEFAGHKFAVVYTDVYGYGTNLPGASLVNLTGPW